MENKTDSKLDAFTRKLMEDFSKDAPSFDFTTKVMSEVEVIADENRVVYKPLISRKSWFVISLVAIGFFAYLIFGDIQMTDHWSSSIQLEIWPSLHTFDLTGFRISNVFLYGVVGFTLFAGIQIFMLKNHFDKQLV